MRRGVVAVLIIGLLVMAGDAQQGGIVYPPAHAVSLSTIGQGGFWGGLGTSFPPVGSVATTVAMSPSGANNVTCSQFVLNYTVLVRKIVFRVGGTAAAASTANLGIYDASGNKFIDSGTFSTASSATILSNTLTTPVSLFPGVYFYCWSDTSTTVTATGYATLAANVVLMYNQNANRYVAATNTTSAGVMPATLGSLTTSTNDFVFGFFEP